jgi:uncharacterized membrane protein (DUF4010 family)
MAASAGMAAKDGRPLAAAGRVQILARRTIQAHVGPMNAFAVDLLVALAIGLLIGLERERGKGQGADRRAAGIRTHAIAALAGATAMHLGGPLLAAVPIAGVTLLAALSYRRSARTDPGLTSEIALILTPLLGAMAIVEWQSAAMLGVVVTVLLAAKPTLHRFVKNTLTSQEVSDGLVIALVGVVIWPLLPDRAMGPNNAINPHMLGLVALLVLSISAAGHVAVRALGPRYGLPVAGLASGFVSSVATIGAMGGRVRTQPATMPAAIAGATLSSLATFIEMAVVLAAVSPPTLRVLASALLAGGGVIAAYGGIYGWKAAHSSAETTAAAGGAFSLKSALLMVAGMAGILLLTANVQPLFGQAGVTLGAAFGGILDTHAAAMSVAALVAAGRMSVDAAVVPVLAAMSANAAMKVGMAFGTGGDRFALRVGAGIGLSLLAAWLVVLL